MIPQFLVAVLSLYGLIRKAEDESPKDFRIRATSELILHALLAWGGFYDAVFGW